MAAALRLAFECILPLRTRAPVDYFTMLGIGGLELRTLPLYCGELPGVYNAVIPDSTVPSNLSYSCAHTIHAVAYPLGTPLVCLYLFGYCWGKHSFGLLSGTLLVILPSWGGLLALTLADGKIFWEMWTSVMTTFLLFSITLVTRVSRRTPSGMTLFSADVCVGLCLETFLANTMTCAVHLIAVLPGEWRDVLGEATWVGRFTVVLSPFCLWYVLHHQGLDIQAATLRGQNMATMYGGGRGRIPSLQAGPHFQAIVCRCIVSIIENSRDLRVTGLSSQQLERLAVIIGDRKEAEYIRFFIKGRRACLNVFDILYAFYQGYTYKGDHARDYKRVRGWIDDWMENKVDDDPLGAIIKLSQEKEPRDCSEALAAICPVRGKMRQNWWLCGLAANVCDEIVSGRGANPPDGVCVEEIKSIDGVSSHKCFALFAAALTINRNPLTVILMGDVKRQARDMLSIMEVGCKQVLRHTTDNGYIYTERGLVLCIPSNGARAAAAAGTRPEGPVRVVTYSAGEVWEAEQRREPVMIGTDAFNTLWRVLMTENRSLDIHERQKLLDDSVEWSGKVCDFCGEKADGIERLQLALQKKEAISLNTPVHVLCIPRILPPTPDSPLTIPVLGLLTSSSRVFIELPPLFGR